MRDRFRQRPRLRGARAFTLLETSLAIVIVGVGVLAMLEAQQAFLRKNSWSTHSTTANHLASEIREMARLMPRHDLASGGIYFENPATQTNFRGWGSELDELPTDLMDQVADIDDLDDLDNVMFGDATPPGSVPISRRLPGPLNAFGDLIPQVDYSGAVVVDGAGEPLRMRDWSQYVIVEKLDPDTFTTVVADDHVEPGVRVNEFPVSVTVVAYFQRFGVDSAPTEVSRVRWIVMP